MTSRCSAATGKGPARTDNPASFEELLQGSVIAHPPPTGNRQCVRPPSKAVAGRGLNQDWPYVAHIGLNTVPPICGSSSVSVGGLGGVDAVAPCLLLGFALSNGSEPQEQNRLQNNSVWGRACGLTRTVVEGVRFDETQDAVVVSAGPNARARSRCGQCGRRSPGYDQGAGRRCWRGLDAGTTRVFIEADAPRIRCRVHGPTVIQVP